MQEENNTYANKIGLPPGSLVYIGKERTAQVTISEINYSTNNFEQIALRKISDCITWGNPENITLVNIVGVHDVAIIEAARDYFSLDPMAMEDVLNTNSRSKLVEYDDYLFLCMKLLEVDLNTNEIGVEQISIFLGKNGLISFQEGALNILEPLKERLSKGKGLIRQKKVDYLFYRLVDTFVDNYFTVTEYLADRLELLEEKVLENPNEDVNKEIYKLKKKITFVKRTISPLRESLSNIIKSDSDLVSDSAQNYFRDVYSHLIYLSETIDSQRDTINDFLNLYMSAMSNKMNEVMKVLTIFASIFIPLTFIAGVYGMNFEKMPELQWKYGYFMILGIMLLVATLLLYYFRRKKWL